MSPKLLVDKYLAKKDVARLRPTWFVTIVDHGDFETVHVTHGAKFRYPRPSHTIYAGDTADRMWHVLDAYLQTRFRASESVIYPDRHGEATNACSLWLLGGVEAIMWFKSAQLRDKYQIKRQNFWKGILNG